MASIDNLFPPDGFRTLDWSIPISFDATNIDINTLSVVINGVPVVTNGVAQTDRYTLTIYETGTDDYHVVLVPNSKISSRPYSIEVNATDKDAGSTYGTATYGTNTYGG